MASKLADSRSRPAGKAGRRLMRAITRIEKRETPERMAALPGPKHLEVWIENHVLQQATGRVQAPLRH
jgi:hypothetical protein